MTKVLVAERKLYEKLRVDLEAKSMGQWVLIRDSEMVAVYPSFGAAVAEAVRRFGRGPYLIREIGAPDMTIPASVVYSHAVNA